MSTSLVNSSISDGCHNPIFTPGIFSDVSTQNETAQTKPAWSNECPPRQNNLKKEVRDTFPEI